MHLTHNIKLRSYILSYTLLKREIGYHSLHRGGVSGCVPSHEPVVKTKVLCQEGWKPVCHLVRKEKGEIKEEERDIFDVTYLSVDRLIVGFSFISTLVSLINVCMLSVLNFMNE